VILQVRDERAFVLYQMKNTPFEWKHTMEPSYVYESPDGGKTIYRREFLRRERTLVTPDGMPDGMPDKTEPLAFPEFQGSGHVYSTNFSIWNEL